MSDVQREHIRQQSRIGRRGPSASPNLVFRAQAEDYIRLNNLDVAEQFLADCSATIDQLRASVRRRREALMATVCAVCGSPFDKGRPAGNEKVRKPGEEALNVYACTQHCFAVLQRDIAQNNVKLYSDDYDQSRSGSVDPRHRRSPVNPQTPI